MELKVDLADGNRKEKTCKIHKHTHTQTYTHTHTHIYIYICKFLTNFEKHNQDKLYIYIDR